MKYFYGFMKYHVFKRYHKIELNYFNTYHIGRIYGYIDEEYKDDTAGNPNKLMEFIK